MLQIKFQLNHVELVLKGGEGQVNDMTKRISDLSGVRILAYIR